VIYLVNQNLIIFTLCLIILVSHNIIHHLKGIYFFLCFLSINIYASVLDLCYLTNFQIIVELYNFFFSALFFFICSICFLNNSLKSVSNVLRTVKLMPCILHHQSILMQKMLQMNHGH
jgi:Zn-dependent protease with chaperone function